MTLSTKVPKACQDAAVGFQSINNLALNLDALKAQLEVEHTAEPAASYDGSSGFADTWTLPGGLGQALSAGSAPGVHDHLLIARGVAVVQATVATPLSLYTLGATVVFGAGATAQMTVVSVGKYFFPMPGYTRVMGHATPYGELSGDVAVARHARVVPIPSPLGLMVYTYRMQDVGGNDILDPAHTGFFLVAFGQK